MSHGNKEHSSTSWGNLDNAEKTLKNAIRKMTFKGQMCDIWMLNLMFHFVFCFWATFGSAQAIKCSVETPFGAQGTIYGAENSNQDWL